MKFRNIHLSLFIAMFFYQGLNSFFSQNSTIETDTLYSTRVLDSLNYNSDSLSENRIKIKSWFSVEGQIYPSFVQDFYKPKIKIRMNLNEKFALRLNMDFNSSKDYKEILQANGSGVGSVEKITSIYQFSLGFEKLRKLENTLLYSGFEGVFGFGKDDEYGSRTDSISYVSDFNYNYKRPFRNIGLRVFFGADYFLKSNIYIGTEFGGLIVKSIYNNSTYQTIDESSVTSSNTTDKTPNNSISKFTFSGLGVVRVGFVFK